MSLEILHLEDFSNEILIDTKVDGWNHAYTGGSYAPNLYNRISSAGDTLFGKYLTITPWGNTDYNGTILHATDTPGMLMTSSAGELKVALQSARGQPNNLFLQLSTSLLNGYEKISWKMDIRHDISYLVGGKVRLRLYTGGHFSSGFVNLGDEAGQLELIVEGLNVRVYLRGKLISTVVRPALNLNLLLYFEIPVIRSMPENPQLIISNLSLVSLGSDFDKQRLGNTKVVRVPVAHVDDVVEPDDGPLNGVTPLDENPLIVTETPVTVDFRIPETVVKGDILGAELVVAATNTETGSHIKVDTLNGETELSTKTTELTSTIDARIPIYSPNLGTKLDDYSDLKLKVSAIEV